MKKLLLYIFIVLVTGNLHSKPYKGAELRTKESFLFGRFEVRYKASSGSGQTSTFFTYNDVDPLDHWNEIDIEMLGRYEDDIQFNIITPSQGQNHVRHQMLDFNPYLDFHTYAFEWTPNYVAWSIDGNEVYRQDESHVATLVRPQKIMMNIWNPIAPNWVGEWDESILPRFAYYDYVSYSSFTPGSGSTGTNNNFTLKWLDHFDAFDEARWDKATHTFPGNNCDFIPENIVYKDGKMILCLTDAVNTGYVDKQPPVIQWARAIGNKVTVGFSEEVEQDSAEDIAGYRILGTNILSAKLSPNLKSVAIEVDSLDHQKSYNLVGMGVKDDATPANKLLGQVVKITMLPELDLPAKINVGGAAVDGFLGDQEWGENVMYGYQDGQKWDNPNLNITDGNPVSVYQSHRNGIVAYKIRIPDGIYHLNLKMAEYYFSEPGKRIFDVYVEGNRVLEHLDLVERVGAQTAYEVTIDNVDVSDQILDIHFGAHVDFPALSGLIIESANASKVSNLKKYPVDFVLDQNYPNPFNPLTNISFSIARPAKVNLSIYNLNGQLIDIIVDDLLGAGKHHFQWDGTLFTTGMYLVKLNTNKYYQIKKIILAK